MKGKAFVSEKKTSAASVLKLVVPIALFLVIALAVVFGVREVSASSRAERLNAIEQAVRRSAVQCYAIEGRYPRSLDYLAQHYGLSVDKNKYVYHYQYAGANILPQIKVFINE